LVAGQPSSVDVLDGVPGLSPGAGVLARVRTRGSIGDGDAGGTGSPTTDDQGRADGGVGDGADHQRAAERGTDSDVRAVRAAAEGDRDQGHDTFR
jgi:hypothetical protein